MDFSQCTNNRERARVLINAGGATKESLMADLGINDKSLASVFAQLRLMGCYPSKGEDGTYSFISKEEFEAAKAARTSKAPAKTLTYEERLAQAQKRETKAATALTNARSRFEACPTRENELRLRIAEAGLELASILLGTLESSKDAQENGCEVTALTEEENGCEVEVL